MSLTVTPPRFHPAKASPANFGERYPLTRAACEMLQEAGFIPERWELIEGELIAKVRQKDRHARAVLRLLAYLLRVVGVERSRTQTTIEISRDGDERNVPEPDGLILKAANDEDRYLTTEDVETVIEICHTTETRDYTRKMPLYARCGIPEYWLLDLNKQMLTIFRDPDAGTGQWAVKTEYGINDSVAPLAAPAAIVRVGDLLP
jgi:Uma2 family endonuclease